MLSTLINFLGFFAFCRQSPIEFNGLKLFTLGFHLNLSCIQSLHDHVCLALSSKIRLLIINR
jgi:hypothetical protein